MWELDQGTERSDVRWSRVGILDTLKNIVIPILVIGIGHSLPRSCDALPWLLRVLAVYDPFDHFCLNLQSKLVLPQNFCLGLVFLRQACNTCTFC